MKQIIWLVLSIFLLSAVVSANVPAPFQGGSAGFEPGGLEEFEAVNEKIFIDLTNLENYSEYTQDNRVKLENVFEFENKNAEKTIKLLMPFDKDYQILLDNVNLEIKAVAENEKTINWQIPNETFWLDGKSLGYRANNRQMQSVSLKIPKGKHTLKLKQNLAPSYNVSGALTKYWQFSFVTLPPENRKNIVKTDIEVKTPPNWETVINPELKNENGVWKGSIADLTPKAFLITTKYPIPQSYSRIKDFAGNAFMFMLFGFPLIALGVCAFFFSKYKFGWTGSFAFGILWSVLLVVTLFFHEFSSENTIPQVHQANYGYGEIGSLIAMAMFAVGGFVLGIVLWLAVWALARYLRKPKQSEFENQQT